MPARDSHTAAYDPAQARIVVFGGVSNGVALGTTQAWDGRSWVDYVSPGPTGTQNAAMAKHPTPGTLILFGGRRPDGRLSDQTWLYRDGAWTLQTITGPAPRWLSAMVFDSFRGVNVLHAGGHSLGAHYETWEYEPRTGWTLQSVAGPQRSNHAMAYDDRRRVTVLFGGYDGASRNDLWEYGGSGWTQRTVTPGPSPRHNHAMCYDSARGRVVVVGGKDDSGTLLDELWEFDGTAWQSFTLPFRCELCTATYDESTRRCVIVGGDADTGPTGSRNEVWEWDGARARLRSPGNAPAAVWPSARFAYAVAFDVGRNHSVLHGGLLNRTAPPLDETWIYDGATWGRRFGGVSPGPRHAHSMAYMLGQAKTVLFGGLGTGASLPNNTYEWDGSAWRQATPTVAPPGRAGAAMTYDLARNRVVMFGGSSSAGPLGDTWEYDGSNWSQRTPAISPPPVDFAMMTYDSRRQRSVLFTGTATWEYGGSSWTQLPMAPPNSAQTPIGMAYDNARGVCVLATKALPPFLPTSTWEYNGLVNQWSPRSQTGPNHTSGAMVFDDFRRSCVQFGGVVLDTFGQLILTDTVQEWNGTTWTTRPRFPTPASRDDHAMAHEPVTGRAILFGGHDGVAALQDTWAFDGADWRLLETRLRPKQRWAFAMASTPFVDPRYGTVWMTGGINGLNQFAPESHVFDPTISDWKVVSVTDPLLMRQNHAMAQHPLSGYPMLFGGMSPSNLSLQDTVTFDGSQWVTQTTAAAPPARDIHAMTYDAARRRVVLFGGRGVGSTILGDTWEFNGRDWALVRTPDSPPGRWNHTLAYDAQRGRVVLTGGRAGYGSFLDDVWEFDGQQWTERHPVTTSAGVRWNAAAAFDTKRARMVVFGGADANGRRDDTWEYFAPTDVGTGTAWPGALPMAVHAAPVVGAPLRLAFASASRSGVLLLAAGPSNRALLPVSPPLSCAPAFLHVDINTAFQLPASGNPCVGGLDVPNDVNLIGAGLSAQGLGVQASGCIEVSLPLVFTLRAP